MWTELAAFVQANTTESLLITIVGTLLVWLYKQFKDMIDRRQQEKVAALQAKQGLFIRLELTIATVLHQSQGESKRELNQLLGDCGPYLSSTQRQLVRDYYRAFDPAVLRTLHAFIIHEVDNISRQSDQEKENQASGLQLYINKLYAPIWPITLIGILILYFFMIYEITKLGDTVWAKANLVLFGLSFFLSVILFMSMVVSWYQKSMGKQGPWRWTAIILIIISPSLFFLFNRPDIAIPVVLLQVGLIIAVAKLKRPNEILVGNFN